MSLFDLGRGFYLSRPLASDSPADLGDVLRTKTALNRLGHFEVPS